MSEERNSGIHNDQDQELSIGTSSPLKGSIIDQH